MSIRVWQKCSYIRAFHCFFAFAASEVLVADTGGDAGSCCGLVSISDYGPLVWISDSNYNVAILMDHRTFHLSWIIGFLECSNGRDVDEQPVQDLALNVDNVFQADDCDAFDSNVDEAPTAQTMFMSNLSSADPVYDETSLSYDSDILSEVHDNDHYQDAVCEHHEVHEMHDDNNIVDNSLTDELATYNEQVKLFERRAKFELTKIEQKINEQLRIVIVDRNCKEENLKRELHSVKLQLSSTINHNKSMVEEVTSLKKDFKQKENKYLEEFLDMKALKEKVEDKLYKQDQSLQTVHMLCKPKPYYDEQNKAIVYNSEDTLEIAEIIHVLQNISTKHCLVNEREMKSTIHTEIEMRHYRFVNQEFFATVEYAIGTCPKDFIPRDKRHAATPLTRKKQVTFEDNVENIKLVNTQTCRAIHSETNVPVAPSTGVNSCTDASGSQPRSNTKKNRIFPAKSANKKKVEEHPRTYKSSLKTTNRIDSSISSHRTVIHIVLWYLDSDLTDYYERVGIFHQKKIPRTPEPNDVVERRNRILVEAARTMLIFSKALMFLWVEAVAIACYTQNRSLIHTRHCKNPYELVHDKKPDLTFFRVFGALCYPTNDSEDLGKLQPTADIGIFVGYAPSRKGYRIYNKRTRRIMETIHVQFDELTEQMAPVQLSTGPAPTFLTPGQISSGLVPNSVPAAPYVPPTNKELEILFQPMFDEYMEPPRVERPVSPTLAVLVPVNSPVKPSSSTFDHDAPSPSHSSSSSALQSLSLHQGIAADSTLMEDNPFAPVDNHPFINVFAPKLLGDRVNIQSRNSGNTGRNNTRAYVQEEIVEGSNAPNETGNVQRTLRTSSLGNTSTVQCYNCSGKGHYARNCPKPRVSGLEIHLDTNAAGKNRMKRESFLITTQNFIQPIFTFMFTNLYEEEIFRFLYYSTFALFNISSYVM
ncbi:retrovirus-related pol polyprotein from transposon TNT 1-94 [Tanacetum coccineum]